MPETGANQRLFQENKVYTLKINLQRLRGTQKTLQLLVSFFSFSLMFLDRLTKVVCVFFFYCSFRRLWLISDLSTWYAVCFQSMRCRDVECGSESMWNLSLQPLKHISTTTMPMAAKFGRVVTYRKGLSPIKSHNLWSRGLARHAIN